MRPRPGARARLTALALLLCCLCEAAAESKTNASEHRVNAAKDQINITNANVKTQGNVTKASVNITDAIVNITEAKENATSRVAMRTLQKMMRWVRRVLQGGDLTYPGSDFTYPGSDFGLAADADYLIGEELTFRSNPYLEDNRIIVFTDSRNTGFVDKRNTSENRGLASDTRNTGFKQVTTVRGITPDTRTTEVAPETKDRVLAPDMRDTGIASVSRDNDAMQNRVLRGEQGVGAPTSSSELSRGSAADRGLQPALSTPSAGQRWLRILAEFLKASSEGRELLRAQAGQLLEGVDVEAGQLPRPVLLLPVPVNAPDTGETGDRPVDDNDDFHRILLELFLAARPSSSLLPPLLLPSSPPPGTAAPLPPLSPAPPPARLRFDRSLLIRAELTVYYSDYTEPYTVWYEAESGSARVDLHGGTTVLYRRVQPQGDVRRVQFRIDRSGEQEVRRCLWLSSRAVAADHALPGLPDPAPLGFDGYQDTADGRMERWTYSLAGQAGELGAARGEALVFRHELLVARVQPDFAIPYKYRVTVDSSVLGPEVDWYEHRYLEVREQRPDPRVLAIDVERECDELQRVYRVEQVDPLREFVMTHRDSRCDADFEKFKETHQINYEDPVDEAIRKTLLIRSTRFVESANRQGAEARMENNELGVMLPAEQRLLRGTRPYSNAQKEETTEGGDNSVGGQSNPGGGNGTSSMEGGDSEDEDGEGILGAPPPDFGMLNPEPFPYSTEEVTRMAAQLPEAFSWKRQGGVTHIRNQGYCTSCWAFAVVCAVEGALFRRTRKLVPLSDQQLADCTRSKRSCSETGVVPNAYLQAKRYGILALGDYPQYMFKNPKLEQCRKREPVVTKISGFVQVPSNTAAVKVSIAMQGPVVMEVDSNCGGFKYFQSGVLRDMRCKPDARDHAVAAIGFSRHKTIGDYFIIKNSWGVAGNGGFVHLHADSNTAGVLTSPSYPVLDDKDIVNQSKLDSLSKSYSDEPSIFKTTSEAEYMAFLKQQKEYLDKNPEVQNSKRRK